MAPSIYQARPISLCNMLKNPSLESAVAQTQPLQKGKFEPPYTCNCTLAHWHSQHKISNDLQIIGGTIPTCTSMTSACVGNIPPAPAMTSAGSPSALEALLLDYSLSPSPRSQPCRNEKYSFDRQH